MSKRRQSILTVHNILVRLSLLDTHRPFLPHPGSSLKHCIHARPEVRDPAGCGDACTCECDKVVAGQDEPSDQFDLFGKYFGGIEVLLFLLLGGADGVGHFERERLIK